jgi:hypothetical protein
MSVTTFPTSVSLLANVAALCCAGVLAGCGSSAPHPTAAPQAAVVRHPRGTAPQSNPDVGDSPSQVSADDHAALGAHAVRDPRPNRRAAAYRVRLQPVGKVERGRVPQGSTNDDIAPTGGKPLDPCTLVSRSQTQAVAGANVAAGIEAPLGPTCIYHVSGLPSPITLTLESLSFGQASHQLHQAHSLRIGARQAYCGTLGRQALLASIRPGQVLDVSAPCAIAQRIAAIALGHLVA